MNKGKAARVYSINKEKLQEAIDAIDATVKSLRDLIEDKKCPQCGGAGKLPLAGTDASYECDVCAGTGYKT